VNVSWRPLVSAHVVTVSYSSVKAEAAAGTGISRHCLRVAGQYSLCWQMDQLALDDGGGVIRGS
jgi:hypothetical protein